MDEIREEKAAVRKVCAVGKSRAANYGSTAVSKACTQLEFSLNKKPNNRYQTVVEEVKVELAAMCSPEVSD